MPRNKLKRIIKKTVKTLTEEVLMMHNSWESYGEFAQRTWGLPHRQKKFTSKQLFQTVQRLKKRGWLEQKKVEDQIYYRLSREGRLRQKMIQFQLQTKEKDSQSTIIIFDIPEAKSNLRHFLRRFLLRNGFILLQESVYITSNKLDSNFFAVLKDMDLLKYITILKGYIYYHVS